MGSNPILSARKKARFGVSFFERREWDSKGRPGQSRVKCPESCGREGTCRIGNPIGTIEHCMEAVHTLSPCKVAPQTVHTPVSPSIYYSTISSSSSTLIKTFMVVSRFASMNS